MIEVEPRGAPDDPYVMRTRVDVRPPFWQRLREVFRRGPPRPLTLGFMFGPAGPDGVVRMQHVDVRVLAPDGIREVDLQFEVWVNGLPVFFEPSHMHLSIQRGAGDARPR